MSTSGKSRRNVEKFLNNSKENNKIREINKINFSNINKNNNSNSNSTEKRRYQYEYSNSKRNDNINLNSIKNDEDEKNILLGLIKEGFITLDELSEKELYNDKKYDINNLQFKNINLEKIINKIIFLNKSLKNTQAQRIQLENERNTFINAINECNPNNKNSLQINNNIKKDINDDNNNLKGSFQINDKNDNMISKEIIKRYENDLNYFEELIKENNNFDDFK